TSPAPTPDQTCTLLSTALKSRRRKQKPASTKEPIPQDKKLRVGYRREKVMIKSVGPGLGPGQAGQRPASTPDQACTLSNTAVKRRRKQEASLDKRANSTRKETHSAIGARSHDKVWRPVSDPARLAKDPPPHQTKPVPFLNTAVKRRRKQEASLDKRANSTRHETQSGISARKSDDKECGAGS